MTGKHHPFRTRLDGPVGILGGGVVGASIAWALAREGQYVTLLEALPSLGQGASGAAIGGITPVTDDFCRGELKLLSKWSTERYEMWLSNLVHDSGMDVPYLNTGILYAALTDQEWHYLSTNFVAELSTLNVRYATIEHDNVTEIDESLSDTVRGVIHIPVEGAVEPPVVMEALVRALRNQPTATVLTDCTVTSIEEDRLGVAVESTRGRFVFPYAVACMGAQSNRVLAPLASLMIGVRGQAIEFAVRVKDAYPLKYHIYAHLPPQLSGPAASIYIVPRHSGRIVAGVTYEPGEETIANTALGVKRILDGAMTLIPNAADWELARMWSGVRPGTKDRKPIIGFLSDHRRLVLATGHFGLGVTLAPVTAQIVLELLGIYPAEIGNDFDIGYLALTGERLRETEEMS